MDKQTLVDALRGVKLTQDEYRSQASLDQVAQLLEPDEIDLRALRSHVISCGVPSAQRSTVWKLLLGYLPPAKARWAAVLEEKRAAYKARATEYNKSMRDGTIGKRNVLKDISVDVPRSYIEGYQHVCSDAGVRDAIKRLLYIWASNNAIGYYQGMMDLIYAVFIVILMDGVESEGMTSLEEMVRKVGGKERFDEVMEKTEADTFYCFDGLMKFLNNAYGDDVIAGIFSYTEDFGFMISSNLSKNINENLIYF